MNSLQLSKRLEKVASYLCKGANFADIGSDHAYLPCFVCLQDEAATAIAGELNEGPYLSALNQVKAQGLAHRISVRKGDGLAVLTPNEVHQVVIAGMGGTLISQILEQGKDKLLGVNRIIAQPNMDAKTLRNWFFENGFELVEEEIIEEDGHFYEILIADRGVPSRPYTNAHEKEFYFGPFLMKQKSETFKNKWLEELDKKQKVIQQMKKASQPDENKITQFEEQVKWMKGVTESE